MAETTQKSSPLPSEAPSAVKPEITDSVAVKLVLDGDIADDVVLRGSWDGWSKDWDLARNKKTLENSVCLNLPCGYYEYKYRGGRRWFCDKSKPMVPNVYGTLNNYMEVKKVPESSSPLVQGLKSKVAHINVKIQKKVDLEVFPSKNVETQKETIEIDTGRKSKDTDVYGTPMNYQKVTKVPDDGLTNLVKDTNKVAHVNVNIQKKIDLETIAMRETGGKAHSGPKKQDETNQLNVNIKKTTDLETIEGYDNETNAEQETQAENTMQGTESKSQDMGFTPAPTQIEKVEDVPVKTDRVYIGEALVETTKQNITAMKGVLGDMEALHTKMVQYKTVLQTVEALEDESDVDATPMVESAGHIYQDIKKNLEDEAFGEDEPLFEYDGQKSIPDTDEKPEQEACTDTTEPDKIAEKPVSDRVDKTEDLDFSMVILPDEKDDTTGQDMIEESEENVPVELTPTEDTTDTENNGWIVVGKSEDEATNQESISHGSVQDVAKETNKKFEQISITETLPDEIVMVTQDIVDRIQDTTITQASMPRESFENRVQDTDKKFEEISSTETLPDETVMALQDIVDKIQDTSLSETPPPEKTTEKTSINMAEKMEADQDAALDVPQASEEMAIITTSPQVKLAGEGLSEIVDTASSETTAHVDTSAAVASVAQMVEEMVTVITSSPIEMSAKTLSKYARKRASATAIEVTTPAEITAMGSTEVKFVWRGETSEDVFVQGSWDGWKQSYSLNKSEEGEHDVTIVLPVGSHEYKYRIGNSWFHDHTKPTMLNAFGTLNNILKIRRADKKLKEDIPLEVIMRDETPDASGLSMEQNIQDSETTDAQASDESTGEGETAEKNAIDIIQEVEAKLQSESMFVPTAADFAEESADKDPIDDLPPEEILQNILSDLAERTEDNMTSLTQPEKSTEAVGEVFPAIIEKVEDQVATETTASVEATDENSLNTVETVEDRLTADSTDEAFTTVTLGSIEVAEKHALLDTSETSGDDVASEATCEGGTAEKNAGDIIEEVKVKLQSDGILVTTAADFAEESADKDPIDDLPPEEILQNVLAHLAERCEYNMYCLDQPKQNNEAAEDHAESYEDSVDSATLPEQQSETTDRSVPETDEKLEEIPLSKTLQDETGMDKVSVDILETSKQMEHTVTTATVVEASEEVLSYKNNTTKEISSYTTSPSEIKNSALPHNHEKLQQLTHTVTKTTATTTTQATEEVLPDTVKKLEQRNTNVILHMEQVGKTAENSFLDTSKKIEDEVAPETASEVENAEKNATDIIEEVKAKLQSEAMVLKTAVDFVEESADNDPMADLLPEEILQSVLSDLAVRNEDNMDYVTLPEQQNVSEEVFTDTVERLEGYHTNTTLHIDGDTEPREGEKVGEKTSTATPSATEKNATDILNKTEDKPPFPAPDKTVETEITDDVQNYAATETSQDKTSEEADSENLGNTPAIVKPPDDTPQDITVDDVNHNAEKEAPPSNETTNEAPIAREEKIVATTEKATQVSNEKTEDPTTDIKEKVQETTQKETQLSDKTTENAPTEMAATAQNETQVSKETTENAPKDMEEKVADTADTLTHQPESSVEKPRRGSAIETRPAKRRVTITLNDYSHIKLLWQGESNGSDVFVCGSWDGWSRSYKLNRGEYSVTLSLPVGMHEYKFRIGDSWFHDKTKTTVRNGMDTLNNAINVPMET